MIPAFSNLRHQSRHHSGARGFSLVETVLALGVMSLAITVLLGLLPHGMEMSRKAGIASGEARVLSDIMAELSQTKWTDLPAYDGRLLYFDDQGVRMTSGADTEVSLLAYVARVQMPATTTVPGGTTPSTNLRRAYIQIAATGNRDFEFDKEGATFSTHTSLLTRLDH